MITLELAISTIVILMTLTFLYKENPIYRLAEYLAVSSASAVLLVTAWRNIEKFGISNLQAGNFVYLFGLLLGILLYARYIPKYDYLSRYGIAVIVGVSFGVSIAPTIRSSILDQLIATAEAPIIGVPLGTAISNIILITIVFSGVLYFIYSLYGTGRTSSSPLDLVALKISKLGRYGLMLAFGTMLGNMVMDRFASVIDALRTLLAVLNLGQI